MKATQLRQSILQAAVQGKLVPQNAHDEPATELLKRIQKEKAQLVKEDKIKRGKPLPPITEDEIPYDLPDGWVWCRLGDVILQNIGGGTPSKQNPDFWNGEIPWASVKDLNCDRLTQTIDTITATGLENSSSNLIPAGSIILCTRMGLGKIAVNEIDVAINQDLRAVFLPKDHVNMNYFIYFYKAQEITGSGMTVKGISLNELHSLLLPLPPLTEQQRIVAKVDELMVLCDELEAAEKELDELETHFAEYLPKSILQAAVQGKLVPQNAHDEPATELLKRIQKEKAQLVKEDKIKRGKPLPPITEDEIPYDLPDGWVWCRLGDVILQNIGGGTPSKQNPDFWNGEIPWASVKDLNCDRLTQTIDTITATGLENSSSNLIPAGSIILCTRMGLGKIAVNEIDVAINQDLRAVFLPKDHVNMNYFIYFYKAQEITGSGMTVKGISLNELHSLLLPLPPLTEQQRIVAKVDELMALCDEMKAAKDISVQRLASNIMPFPQQGEDEREIGIAARGEMQEISAEAARDIREMFGDDSNA